MAGIAFQLVYRNVFTPFYLVGRIGSFNNGGGIGEGLCRPDGYQEFGQKPMLRFRLATVVRVYPGIVRTQEGNDGIQGFIGNIRGIAGCITMVWL